MSKTTMYVGAAALAAVGVGFVYYISKKNAAPAPGRAAAVAAANKAGAGQAANKGGNVFDFGSALVTAGASAFGAYEKSNTSETALA